jgi:thioesterase domain-containing protein
MSEIDSPFPVIFLPAAGGEIHDLEAFTLPQASAPRVEAIRYPGWQRYAEPGFSAESLIQELAAQIATKVPNGPIHMVGVSLGGHLGYAIALRLQKMGRDVAGLCAVDSFMVVSSEPSAGWQRRALAEGLGLLRKRRFRDFIRFGRARFWRLVIRASGGRAAKLLGRMVPRRSSLPGSDPNPVFESELSMRMLIRETAPWLASLDREPVALHVPVALLRTHATSGDDAAWRRRCPNIQIYEVIGAHHTLFYPENMGSFREAFTTATREWYRP